MQLRSPAGTLVVNFNAPELNSLAIALAREGRLGAFVRPYVNKGRLWERALAASPVGGALYASTFGRRRLGDAGLARLTLEAGVGADMFSALIGRSSLIPDRLRHRWTNRLHMHVRQAVAETGARLARDARCVVAYEGFALPSFEASRDDTGARRFLNYPVAHHRARRRIREEELTREPTFASSWPGFDDWGPDHEERLDREIELADGILLGSAFAADSFAAEGVPREKLLVVPYGVDLTIFRPADRPITPRPFRVIYAGQLTQRKGLSYLLRGYREFRRADSELTLVGAIVGDSAPLAPFADLFTHIPHQTRRALAERYRASNVLVFPTLVEGMPLVVLEAMACGLPVIVTANGPGGIVRDGIDGYIVPERDDEAIADRLERLYEDPERTAAMGRNAARRAQEFSWERYTTQVTQHLGAPTRSDPGRLGVRATAI